MKVDVILNKTEEEKATIITHSFSNKIKKVVSILEDEMTLNVYKDETIKKLEISDIVSVFTNNNKVYISTEEGEYMTKLRLYQVEEFLDESFIKINQGCLINLHHIKEFKSDITATLKVVMKNGFNDYIARRELKKVKEKLGL